MSQLVACQTDRCLILAADRRVETRVHGETRIHTAQKLYPLGDRAVVATSGAAMGIETSRELTRSVVPPGPPTLDELEAYALHVFERRYDAFQEQGKAWFDAHPDALRRSYILLGGFTGPTASGEHAFRFHGSESHDQPYRRMQTAHVLTAPRRLGLETRLVRATLTDADPQDLCDLIVDGLKLIEKNEHTVHSPFDLALFDGSGRHLHAASSDTTH